MLGFGALCEYALCEWQSGQQGGGGGQPTKGGIGKGWKRRHDEPEDQFFYEWWRKKKEEIENPRQPEPIIAEATEAVPAIGLQPARLNPATLAELQDVESLQDIEDLIATLRGTQAQLVKELLLAYERERDEEEAIELLLLH